MRWLDPKRERVFIARYYFINDLTLLREEESIE